jgi:hypothetical protein
MVPAQRISRWLRPCQALNHDSMGRSMGMRQPNKFGLKEQKSSCPTKKYIETSWNIYLGLRCNSMNIMMCISSRFLADGCFVDVEKKWYNISHHVFPNNLLVDHRFQWACVSFVSVIEWQFVTWTVIILYSCQGGGYLLVSRCWSFGLLAQQVTRSSSNCRVFPSCGIPELAELPISNDDHNVYLYTYIYIYTYIQY